MIPIQAQLEMMGVSSALTASYRSSSTPRPFCHQRSHNSTHKTDLDQRPRLDFAATDHVLDKLGRGEHVRQALGGDQAVVVGDIAFQRLCLRFHH